MIIKGLIEMRFKIKLAMSVIEVVLTIKRR